MKAKHYLSGRRVVNGVLAAILLAATPGASLCPAAQINATDYLQTQPGGETHVNFTITKGCPPRFFEVQDFVVMYSSSRDNAQNQTICQLQVDVKKHECSPYNAYCSCVMGDDNRTVYRVARNGTDPAGEVWYFIANGKGTEQLHKTIRVAATGVPSTQHEVIASTLTAQKTSLPGNKNNVAESSVIAIAVSSAAVIIVIATVAVACHYRRKTLVVTWKCQEQVAEEPLAQKRATFEDRSKSVTRVTPPPLPESNPVPPPVPPSDLIPYDVSEPFLFPHGDPNLVDGPSGTSGVRTFMPPTYLEHTVDVSLNTNTATAYYSRRPVQGENSSKRMGKVSEPETQALVYSSNKYHEPWDKKPCSVLNKGLDQTDLIDDYDDLTCLDGSSSIV